MNSKSNLYFPIPDVVCSYGSEEKSNKRWGHHTNLLFQRVEEVLRGGYYEVMPVFAEIVPELKKLPNIYGLGNNEAAYRKDG